MSEKNTAKNVQTGDIQTEGDVIIGGQKIGKINTITVDGNGNYVITDVHDSSVVVNDLDTIVAAFARHGKGVEDLLLKLHGRNEAQLQQLSAQLQKLLEGQGTGLDKFLTDPPFQTQIFVGREEELETVRERLFGGENFLMLVNGRGGIGKTTFAAKYWQRYKDQYSHLAFLYVENGIAEGLLSLSRKLGLQFTTETVEQQLQILTETVAQLPKPCLLILDNANDEEDLDNNLQLLRKCDNFHILLTSRLAEFDYAQKYPLGTLAPDQALALFKKHYPKLETHEEPLFEEIYHAVGGNTLVLELLAKNLTQINKLRTKYHLSDLKDDLQESLLKLSHSKTVKTAYQAKGTGIRRETPEAIIIAMYDLSDLEEAEVALLSVFAVLPAENIELDTLTKLLQDEDLDNTLLSLAQKGWIEQSGTSFKASPVIQEITRQKNAERLYADTDTLINQLAAVLHPEKIQNNPDFVTVQRYVGYAESAMRLLDAPTFTRSMLLERIGIFYDLTGDLQRSLTYYTLQQENAKRHAEQNPENPELVNNLAISYSKLGQTHSALGNLEKALHFFEEYNRLEKELHESYPTQVEFKNGLAISYSKLGETHSALGNLEKALHFFELDIKLSKELYAQHPTQVGFKNGLAISYKKLGDTHSALGNLEQALHFFELDIKLSKELYAQHPTQVGFKNGLAISYSKLGETHSALGNLEKALHFFEEYNRLEKELHESHPTQVDFKNGLAISYSKLGETHSALGKLEQALHFFEEYNRLKKELYAQHPTQVGFKNGLAISYEKLGETHRALGNLEKALHFFEVETELFGELYEQHPTQVGFKNNLAISYAKLGETHSALGKLEQALHFFEEYNRLEKELHESYTTQVGFKNNLAISCQFLGNTHTALGNLEQALHFFEEYNRLKKELYEQHPTQVGFKNGLAVSHHKLAMIYEKLGRIEEAYQNALLDVRHTEELRQISPQHAEFRKNLVNSYNQLARIAEVLGKTEEAGQYRQQAAELDN